MILLICPTLTFLWRDNSNVAWVFGQCRSFLIVGLVAPCAQEILQSYIPPRLENLPTSLLLFPFFSNFYKNSCHINFPEKLLWACHYQYRNSDGSPFHLVFKFSKSSTHSTFQPVSHSSPSFIIHFSQSDFCFSQSDVCCCSSFYFFPASISPDPKFPSRNNLFWMPIALYIYLCSCDCEHVFSKPKRLLRKDIFIIHLRVLSVIQRVRVELSLKQHFG